MISNRLSLKEREKIIGSWDFPWPELLSVYQQSRDSRLEHADDDSKRDVIKAEYERSIDRIIAAAIIAKPQTI